VACVAALRNDDADFAQFMDFVKKFNKTYPTVHEFQARFRVFQMSLDRVAGRRLVAVPRANTAFGITKFSDLTPTEFKSMYLGSVPPRFSSNASVAHPLSEVTPPTSYDWRSQGAVSAVKDQEQCGSCWAFSATEEIESMTYMKNKVLPILAPQQIVSCDTQDSGCDGGWPYLAYQYVESAGGMTTEAQYPYTSGGGDSGTCALGNDKLASKVNNYYWAVPPCTDSCDSQNEDTLLQVLFQQGPLSVCVDAESWQDYMGGILPVGCPHDYSDLDHCVQLVGYNEASDKTPYWIVRNSWNTDWGISGYIYIERGTNECGIADSVTYVDAVSLSL